MYSDWEGRSVSMADRDRKLALREPLTQLTTGIIRESVVSATAEADQFLVEHRLPSALELGWPCAFADTLRRNDTAPAESGALIPYEAVTTLVPILVLPHAWRPA